MVTVPPPHPSWVALFLPIDPSHGRGAIFNRAQCWQHAFITKRVVGATRQKKIQLVVFFAKLLFFLWRGYIFLVEELRANYLDMCNPHSASFPGGAIPLSPYPIQM